MNFHIVTLFPELFENFLRCSIVGKAMESGKIAVNLIDPRDFVSDKHRTVDDTPYGGGRGMVLKPEPVVLAMEAAGPRDAERPRGGKRRGTVRILLTPQGEPLSQAILADLKEREELVLVCGRYEGIDERVRDFVDLEISLGDFVLGGGEIPAMALVEGVSRLIPEVIGSADSLAEESHSAGLLEYPQFTRPRDFRGRSVPEVLISGDHGRIGDWRRREMLARTRDRRPDLWSRFEPSDEDQALLQGDQLPKRESNGWAAADADARLAVACRTFIALVHHPVVDRSGKIVTTALTNLDLHDIARSSRTYGLAGYFVVTPLTSQRALVERILAHWRSGHGASHGDQRREALSLVQIAPDLSAVRSLVAEREGTTPLMVATTAALREDQISAGTLLRLARGRKPVVIIMGTGWGLAEEVLSGSDYTLAPVRSARDYNHLSVRSAAGIILDRLFGMRDEPEPPLGRE